MIEWVQICSSGLRQYIPVIAANSDLVPKNKSGPHPFPDPFQSSPRIIDSRSVIADSIRPCPCSCGPRVRMRKKMKTCYSKLLHIATLILNSCILMYIDVHKFALPEFKVNRKTLKTSFSNMTQRHSSQNT